ncbi:MAG: hypothetical protein K1V89_04235 [Muribaculaceae bacterium]|jgi:multidrug efflux pump subunit AcrB
MNKMGRSIFWIGFTITVCVVIAYIVMMLIYVTTFASWIASLILCGTVLLGSVLMLIGRSIERKSGDEI